MPENIEITDEIKHALDLMENSRKHLFVTGKAGTGKSTLLRHFCDNTKKKIVVLAPTGVAALNVKGSTLHSFFQFNFGVVEEKDLKFLPWKKEVFQNLEAIVIDEISMVRSDLMNAIDFALQKNTGNKGIPFGGVQMIMFGDLYQLPPVVIGVDERTYLDDRYGGVYFFNAPVFKEIDLEKIQLSKNFRQEDSFFVGLLNGIRENALSQNDLNAINERFCKYNEDEPAITLAPTNKVVDTINKTKLDEIADSEKVYKAVVGGDFKENDYPAEDELQLKVGAQIMMIKNDHMRPQRWVNGSLGVVKALKDEAVIVVIQGIEYKVGRDSWEIYDYEYDQKEDVIEKNIKGAFAQLPIKLAWAVTIHKSQGKTFNRMIVDMGRGAWLHGQTYVALSRCTSLSEIYLKTRIQFRDIVVDKAVAEFHSYD